MTSFAALPKKPFLLPSTKASMVTSLAALLAACGGGESDTVGVVTPANTPDQDGPVNGGNDDAPTKVSLMINTGGQGSISETDVDQLDIVFQVSASFDAKVLDDDAVINLGLDRNGDEMASLGRADFDELSVENATLNIHATQKNVEVDYKKGVEGNLTINFENNDGAIVVGEDDFRTSPNQAIQVFDATTIGMHHLSDQSATVQGTILIDDFTTDIVVSTSQLGGDLSLIGADSKPTFSGAAELQTITVNGVNGDLRLISFDSFHGRSHLTDDATNLQTLKITGHDSVIEVGSIGYLSALLTAVVNPVTFVIDYTPVGFASDLETIHIALTGSASLYQHPIVAYESDIANVTIRTGEVDSVTSDFNLHTAVNNSKGNIAIEALSAQKIEQMLIDTSNGGGIVMENQVYLVGNLTFVGSGDIIIAGPANPTEFFVIGGGTGGVRQVEAADASDHTGERIFYGRLGQDVFYGSTGDDTIVFQKINHPVATTLGILTDNGDAYYDSGGNDVVYLGGYERVQVYDGDAGTDDTYLLGHGPYATGFYPYAMNFHAGSGNDLISFEPSLLNFALPTDISIDFGTWLNGSVDIDGFETTLHKISLDGLPGITTTFVETVSPGTILTLIDDNQVYLGLDGNLVLNGQSVTDYTDLSDVAAYLNAFVSGNSEEGDSAVFILENGTAAVGEADYYFYLFNESDGLEGISPQEIVNFASVELVGFGPGSGPLTANDFV